MTIPDFQSLMLPILEIASDERDHASRSLVEAISDRFNLSSEERSQRQPSQRQTTIYNRVHWAITYLAKCGLLERPQRGLARITKRGKEALSERPEKINLKFLTRYPELEAFRSVKSVAPNNKQADANVPEVSAVLTPDERLREAHREIEATLRSDLLARVLSEPADFFETVVVDLLVAMGYGGTFGRSTRLGKSGDGGLDGVVNQDALGLDRVYVQAKRYSTNKVSAGDIRNFFGGLDAVKASKGVFITTSEFTHEARSQAEKFSKRIVLMDGQTLAAHMVQYGVGVRVEERVEIKKVDEDYFADE